MASNLNYSAALRTAQVAAISTQLGGSAVIEIYDGTQPATPETAVSTQVLLCSHTCAATFGAASGGVLTLGAIGNGTGTAGATASGKRATWARIKTSGGTAHIDCSVGTNGTNNTTGAAAAGETYDININNNLITTGTVVAISGTTITNGQ